MFRRMSFRCLLIAMLAMSVGLCAAAASAAEVHEGKLEVRGAKLEYRDWGGAGQTIILLPGLDQGQDAFDGFASALAKQFRVVTYSRRGTGGSDHIGPYDVASLTADLNSVMNALGISKAVLVGLSAGGGEITQMAADHPDRVLKIVYLEGGYDGADPEFRTLAHVMFDKVTGLPTNQVWADEYEALWDNPRAPYGRVKCPALAIYATRLFDIDQLDPSKRLAATEFQKSYWFPFQQHSIARLRTELRGVKISTVEGAHGTFFVTNQQRVLSLIGDFLSQ